MGEIERAWGLGGGRKVCHCPVTWFTGKWVIPRSGSVPLICHLPHQNNALMAIAISL